MNYALVAGGSKGIGFAIAMALAKRNYNLVLIGRDGDALSSAKNQLESLYNINVEVMAQDLSLPEAAVNISLFCIQKHLPLKMLCNVAGMGGKRDYLNLPPGDLRYMISLNIASQMALSLSLLPLLQQNAPSYILNVASMAGFAPIPAKNLYSATKSAVISFSYALRYQLQNKDTHVSCLCPGPVFTKPEIKKDTIDKLGWIGKAMAVEPARVGEIAVQGTLKHKMIITPGILSKTMSLLLRIAPRRLITFIYFKLG